jgi:uncharacterized protein YbjT (DUF2867 family)
MILVTGASGRVGRTLVSLLGATGRPFRALVRTAEAVELVQRSGGAAVLGDLDRPDTVATAMHGVETALLLCPMDELAIRRTETFTAAAHQAGVRRLVRMSGMGTGTGPDIPIARAQRDGEVLVERSGLAWTHLRPNTFMTNFLASVGSIAGEGVLYAPAGDAAVSFIDPRDVAAVTAHVLTTDGHDGQAYDLTGPQALDHNQVAEAIAAATGQPVKYVDIPGPVARDAMVTAGMSPWYVDLLIGFYDALRSSAFWATVTPTIEQLTDRSARTFSAWAREQADAFAPTRQ